MWIHTCAGTHVYVHACMCMWLCIGMHVYIHMECMCVLVNIYMSIGGKMCV